MSRTWNFNGFELKTPSEYEFKEYDLSSEVTGRSLNGTAYKDIIARKREIDVTWWSLRDSGDDFTTVQLLGILRLGAFGTLVYPDPESGTNVSRRMYVGDRECAMYQVKNDVAEYKFSCTFIEE